MNFIDKVGAGVSASIDLLVDKNRQIAQLNRLSTIIRTETELINNAYIALGKQYRRIIEGEETETGDLSQIVEAIKFSEQRLKKAQARYDYIKVYGVPNHAGESVEMGHIADTENDEEHTADTEAENTDDDAEEENADITIAYADDKADKADESKSEEAAEKTAEEKAVNDSEEA